MTKDDAFARLAKNKFRSRFKLTAKDREYIVEKGMATIRRHAEDFVAKKLAPAQPENDGKQTPMRGHPVSKRCTARRCAAGDVWRSGGR